MQTSDKLSSRKVCTGYSIWKRILQNYSGSKQGSKNEGIGNNS